MNNCTRSTDGQPQDMPAEVEKVLLTVSLTVAIFGFLPNTFIVISFCKVKFLRTVTNYFIINLAVADLMILVTFSAWLSCQFIPLGMSETQELAIYNFLTSMDIFCSSASLASLACVSVDRCLAVTRPLRYQAMATHSRAIVVVIVVWTYCLLTFIYAFLRETIQIDIYNKIYIICLFSCSFVLAILVTSVSYFRIFRAVWHQVHQTSEPSTSGFQRSRFVMKEFRVAINILVTIVPIYFMWGGFWIDAFKEAVTGRKTIYHYIVEWLISCTPIFAAAFNPIIYISMTRDYRLLLLRLLSCKRNTSNVWSNSPPSSIKLQSCTTIIRRTIPMVDVTMSDEYNTSHTTSDTRSSSGQCMSTDSSCVTSSPVEEQNVFPSFQ